MPKTPVDFSNVVVYKIENKVGERVYGFTTNFVQRKSSLKRESNVTDSTDKELKFIIMAGGFGSVLIEPVQQISVKNSMEAQIAVAKLEEENKTKIDLTKFKIVKIPGKYKPEVVPIPEPKKPVMKIVVDPFIHGKELTQKINDLHKKVSKRGRKAPVEVKPVEKVEPIVENVVEVVEKVEPVVEKVEPVVEVVAPVVEVVAPVVEVVAPVVEVVAPVVEVVAPVVEPVSELVSELVSHFRAEKRKYVRKPKLEVKV